MFSASGRKLFVALVLTAFIFVLPPQSTAKQMPLVRAVYRSGLVLNEEPAGTIVADATACLPKADSAKRYDYPKQLAETVAKANTRMTALVLEKKIAGYTGSIELLDRNIALISGTIASLKKLDGVTGYLLPIGARTGETYSGAAFEGKCYKGPGVEIFGHPDALGALNPAFDKAVLFAETSDTIEKALKEELPKKLGEFAALEQNKKLSKKQHEEQFGKLTDEVMEKVGDFVAIDPVTAAALMPREFGGRGIRLPTTPSISLVSTGQPCTYVIAFGKGPAGKLYDITVSAISASHTFRKCMPEEMALKMLKHQLEEKKELLQKERSNYVKLLSASGKALAALQKSKPQYFGD